MTADFKQAANLAGKILKSGCVNPSYVVSFVGVPTGGTFTLAITTGVNGPSPNAQSTGAITYAAGLTAASVQTTIQALTGLSAVTVSGSNGGPFTITIPNALGVGTVAVTASALTGGTSPTTQVNTAGVDATILDAVTAATAVKLATICVTNAAATAGVLSVSVIPPGGSQDGTHRVLSAYSLAANDTVSHEDALAQLKPAMLDAGASIVASCTQPFTYLLTGAVSS